MKKTYLLVLLSMLLLPASFTFGQFLIENFEYPAGDSLTQHGWTAHSGGTTNAILVTSPGLIYPDYPSSGIGNAATLTTSGQDVNKQFTPLTSGAIYASLMVSIISAHTGDYFFHLGLANTTSTFMGRVFVKLAANNNLAFGLSKTATSTTILPVYSDSIYTTGTTYLLVLKYQFNAGANDDTVSLFINPVVSPTEPTPQLVHGTSASNDPANIGGVYIRQGSASLAANLILDGIRLGTAWAAIIPVELTSFTSTADGNNVFLNWSTATELNNLGFEVQRKFQDNEFATIGFVSGHGTTTEPKNYSFVDRSLSAGNYAYRLKQVDYNGAFAYSDEINVDVTGPFNFELAQNYPNPFNPSTKIEFRIADPGFVSLKVFDILGNEIATLVNDHKPAGGYEVEWNAAGFPSGVYFYRLDAGLYSEVKRMILIR
jgi:hypothetical protein